MRTLHDSGLTGAISTLAACLTLIFSTPLVQAAETNKLRAGAAKVDITPKDLTGLVSVWNTPFSGVHDPIFARAPVLDNGTSTAAVVATDLVEIGRTLALRQRIARAHSTVAGPDHTLITGDLAGAVERFVKKESPFTNTIMATIANDRIGYIAEDLAIDVVYRRAAIVRGCAEDGIVNGLVDMITEHL